MPSTRRAVLVALAFALVLAVPAARAARAPHETTRRLSVLITNDDGVDAPGLVALATAIARIADVTVVAPATQQSGVGHGFTWGAIEVRPVVREDGLAWWAVDGKPATAVRVGLDVLLPRRPDLVLSGINSGENLGLGP